jgi:hypothetical protein
MTLYANRITAVLMSWAFLMIALVLVVAGDLAFMAGDLLPAARMAGGGLLFLAGISFYPTFSALLARLPIRETLAATAAIVLGIALVFIESAATSSALAGPPGSVGNCGTLMAGWITTGPVQTKISRSRPLIQYAYRSLEDSCRIVRAGADPRTASTLAGVSMGYLRTYFAPSDASMNPNEREYDRIARALEATANTLEALRSRPPLAGLLASPGLPKNGETEFLERTDRILGHDFTHGLLNAGHNQEAAFMALEKKSKSDIDPTIDRDRAKITLELNRITAVAPVENLKSE